MSLIGNTFLAKIKSDKQHLYIIISQIEDYVLVVNITSLKPENMATHDSSCVLDISENYSHIKQDSWVYYEGALEMHVNYAFNCVENDALQKVSDSTLKKIQNGAKATERLTKKYRKYFDGF